MSIKTSQNYSLQVARELRQLRQAKGLSQLSVAEKAGLSRAAIQHIEKGIRNPTLMVAHAISTALEMPLSRVLTKVEKSATAASFSEATPLPSPLPIKAPAPKPSPGKTR